MSFLLFQVVLHCLLGLFCAHTPQHLQPLLTDSQEVRVLFPLGKCEDITCAGVRTSEGVVEVQDMKEADIVLAAVHQLTCDELKKAIQSHQLVRHHVPFVALDWSDGPILKCGPLPEADFYFKRSLVTKKNMTSVSLPRKIYHLPYALRGPFGEKMSEELKKPHTRTLDICCLHGPRWNGRPVATQPGMGMREYIKATLKTFFSKNKGYSVQLGAVSPTGTVGRNTFNNVYISTMANCKIIVTANPKLSEGDYRLMETLSSGAMVMEDDMVFPPPGLKDEFNIVFYNRSTLIPKLTYYLEHQETAREIGKEGTKEAFAHHLPQHLISRVLTTVANSLANNPPLDTAVILEPHMTYNLTNRYRLR